MAKTFELVFSIVFFTLISLSQSYQLNRTLAQCDRDDPTTCPTNNGFQQICVCIPFGGGCWCDCEAIAEEVNGTCMAKPTKIGEDCRFFSSCSNIEGAANCDQTSDMKCACEADLYPIDDMSKCIKRPVAIDEPCSAAATCEAVLGSSCQEVEGSHADAHACRCEESLYPNFDNTACLPRPKIIGDPCSPMNPCTNIPSAKCVQVSQDDPEPQCQCRKEYSPSDERQRCLPTRIGVKCSAGSSCENMDGAICWGEPKESRCTCIGSIPNMSMTKCNN